MAAIATYWMADLGNIKALKCHLTVMVNNIGFNIFNSMVHFNKGNHVNENSNSTNINMSKNVYLFFTLNNSKNNVRAKILCINNGFKFIHFHLG